MKMNDFSRALWFLRCGQNHRIKIENRIYSVIQNVMEFDTFWINELKVLILKSLSAFLFSSLLRVITIIIIILIKLLTLLYGLSHSFIGKLLLCSILFAKNKKELFIFIWFLFKKFINALCLHFHHLFCIKS